MTQKNHEHASTFPEGGGTPCLPPAACFLKAGQTGYEPMEAPAHPQDHGEVPNIFRPPPAPFPGSLNRSIDTSAIWFHFVDPLSNRQVEF
jgi:hypothetical protein